MKNNDRRLADIDPDPDIARHKGGRPKHDREKGGTHEHELA